MFFSEICDWTSIHRRSSRNRCAALCGFQTTRSAFNNHQEEVWFGCTLLRIDDEMLEYSERITPNGFLQASEALITYFLRSLPCLERKGIASRLSDLPSHCLSNVQSAEYHESITEPFQSPRKELYGLLYEQLEAMPAELVKMICDYDECVNEWKGELIKAIPLPKLDALCTRMLPINNDMIVLLTQHNKLQSYNLQNGTNHRKHKVWD